VAMDPARRARMSMRNLIRSQEFRREVMIQRKLAFCRHLRAISETPLNAHNAISSVMV
jgi:hypothetical protein